MRCNKWFSFDFCFYSSSSPITLTLSNHMTIMRRAGCPSKRAWHARRHRFSGKEVSRHRSDRKDVPVAAAQHAFEGGWMRMMFAADYEAGLRRNQAYHTWCWHGRCATSYRSMPEDGELLAVLDGKRITDLRTARRCGVLARRVPLEQPVTVGLNRRRSSVAHAARMPASVYAVECCGSFQSDWPNRDCRFAREMRPGSVSRHRPPGRRRRR